MARQYRPGRALAQAVASVVWIGMASPNRILAGFLLLMAAAVLLPSPAQAAIYKCVTSTGDTTYTSARCAQDQSTKRISSNAAVIHGLDCRIAHRLAFETSYRMMKGETSDTIFNSYGGVSNLSPLVLALVDFVFSFENDKDASISRIAALASEHCQVGSFGALARHCDSYPREFIDRVGGCSAARKSMESH